MKIALLIIITLFCLDVFLFAENIPPQLQAMGLNRYSVLKITYDNAYHYYTFDDWVSREPGCSVTFIVYNGEVIDFYRDCSAQESGEQQ